MPLFTLFSIAIDGNMVVNFFCSQNQTSSGERDSLTPCNMHLTPCNMQKILYDYLSTKWIEIFLGILYYL